MLMPNAFREILSDKKMFRTRVGNLLGLQVLRVALARAVPNRRRRARAQTDTSDVRSLLENGYCVIPGFLPHSQFQTVLAEYDAAMNSGLGGKKVIRDVHDYIRETVYITPENATAFPHTYAALHENKRLRELFLANEARAESSFAEGTFQVSYWRHYFDAQRNMSALESDHSNSDLHSDTFHTTSKAFLYLRATNDRNGAHKFAPRSHNLSTRRLWFEYVNSIGRQEESPRVMDDVLRRMGLTVIDLSYPENTLIVVNTFGFHGAGSFAPGQVRDVIYVQYRGHPFR